MASFTSLILFAVFCGAVTLFLFLKFFRFQRTTEETKRNESKPQRNDEIPTAEVKKSKEIYKTYTVKIASYLKSNCIC
jgi:hypothetical protein